MRRIYIYILALLALSVACQQIDLPEVNQPAELPTGAIQYKVLYFYISQLQFEDPFLDR